MGAVSYAIFPPPEPLSRRLSLSAFIEQHQNLCDTVGNRIIKLERLQSYQEPKNASFEAFVGGDYQRSINLIPQMRAEEAESYTRLFRRGVQFIRIRAVELPLSEYLKWELQTYAVSARYGETILLGDITNEPIDGALNQASDFILYDDRHVFVHDYSSEGLLSGGWLIEDVDYIAKCRDIARQFLAISVPLAVFENKVQAFPF